MKISLNWIKDFVTISPKYSAQHLADLLTMRTAEVDSFESQGQGLSGVVVGEIIEITKHPHADKLNVAKVNIGREKPLQLVFGQMVKMNVGDRVPVAVAPTTLPTGIEIAAKDLRGVRSGGMLCLDQELGLKNEGISITYFPKIAPGTLLAAALGYDDTIFEIDNKSLTHRPDLWGHFGMAREFSAFLKKPLRNYEEATGIKKFRFPAKGESAKVKIQTEKISPRFSAAIVTGVKIEPSPEWMQKRLLACGVRPINNVVDITNYVMLELGQPMHAFDRRVVETDILEARYSREGEILETIDHKKRKLHPEDAMITNGRQILGIAGVMGGTTSEISDKTTEIIFEAANWNPVMIRKTATRHGLRTDAAQRFEKGLDPKLTLIAITRACKLLLEMCPTALLAGPATDIYLKKPRPLSITVDAEKVRSKIGMMISEKEMIAHLNALGFKTSIAIAKKGKLKVIVPSFRLTKDIDIEEDIVEEIARMHGYEKIPAILPSLPIRLPIPNMERTLKHEARNILSLALGFTETSSYSFYGAPEIRNCMLPEGAHVLLDNPLTEDQTHMRISLLPHLLKSVALNFRHEENLKLYEIGRTYIKRTTDYKLQTTNYKLQTIDYRLQTTDYFPREEKFIAGIVVRPDSKGEIFYKALGALESFLKLFRAPSFLVQEAVNAPPYAHPTKCASIVCRKNEIASVFELHPRVLKNFGIESACAAFEINFSRLVALGQMEIIYRPIPRFPGIEIDISVVVDKKTPVREVQELISRTNTDLIARIALIDIFEGGNIGADKKSLTFRVLLQSPDRTLTDEEMKQLQERIFKTLQDRGFAIRGL